MPDLTETYTYDDLLQYLEDHPEPGKTIDDPASMFPPDNSWSGASYADAIRLAHEGWPEGLSRMESLTIDNMPVKGKPRPRCEYAPYGARPSIPHYIAGDPAHMQNWTPKPSSRNPVISIILLSAVNWKVNPDHYMIYGARIASMIDAIENEGVSVNLTIRFRILSVKDKKTVITTDIEAKTAGQPLDMDRLIFMIAHPAFFRRIIFRVWERDEYKKHLGMSYGYAMTGIPKTGEFFLPLLSHDKPVPDVDYLIGLYRTHVTDVTEMEA